MKLCFNTHFLQPVSFLKLKFKDLNLDNIDNLNGHAADITFLCLRCELGGNNIDNRINRTGNLSLEFFLEFPIHI